MSATPETYELRQLTAFLQRVLALNFSEPLWISAELAQVSEGRGHHWLTLVQKDEETDEIVAQLGGVIWATTLKTLRRQHGLATVRGLLQNGMSVRLRVRMTYHERFGMRLVVEEIDPAHTIGALELRRQAVLERLAAANLLGRNAAVDLPLTPQRLAIISSDTAAGLADFMDQLAGNTYGYTFSTKVFTAAMQGAQTSPEILARLREIKRFWRESFDAVVIVRGGGGRTDLAAFDEEQLCRGVAEFPLPVLVGIGHETDETVLDRVAHRSLKTPTAAAVYLSERLARAEAVVLQAGRRIMRIAQQTLQQEVPRLNRTEGVLHQSALLSVRDEQRRLEQTSHLLQDLPLRQLRTEAERLRHREDLLRALDPNTTLRRGYALVSQGGKLITDPGQLRPGKVSVRLRDGETILAKEAE